MNLELLIQNKDMIYAPAVQKSLIWETVRSGQPGKLSFTVFADEKLNVEEGNAVRLTVDGTALFYGYIFERSSTKDGLIKITAYDQLRYLKNKDTYNYENLKASEVVQMIARDFGLATGEIEDTGYVIPARRESNKALFDIILTALDYTMVFDKKMYILYDDAGKLTLKNVENMKQTIGLQADTAGDYDYKSSIDGETYNRVKLYYNNKDTGKEEYFTDQDQENVKQWGVLQYFSELKDPSNAQEEARKKLEMYNKKTKTISIKNALGDKSVRAGCLIPTILKAGDTQMNHYMLAESVTHTFDGSFHSMDLKLKGSDFFG